MTSIRALPDTIPFTQRARVAWSSDGFYYTVHPAPGTVPPGDEHYYRRVRYHRLGDDPARDALVFGEGLPKERLLSVEADAKGRWVVLSSAEGWTRNASRLAEPSPPPPPPPPPPDWIPVALNATKPTPETTAFMVLLPASFPRVHCVEALPSSSVVLLPGSTRPPPLAITQVTARLGTPFPSLSTRRTTRALSSSVPAPAL